jgi:hypothetical protein
MQSNMTMKNRNGPTRSNVGMRSTVARASFWLSPLSVRDFEGYNRREVERLRRIVGANRELLLRRWHEFFDQRS